MSKSSESGIRVISPVFARNTITRFDDDMITKQGPSTWPNEGAAIKLVQAHTPDVPVPTVYDSEFKRDPDGIITMGKLYMEFIPGETLEAVWPRLSMSDKERLCRDTWTLINKLRLIPRPQDGEKLEDGSQPFYCAADGTSHIINPLLGDIHDYDRSPPFRDDEALRNQIWKRYVEHNGLSYPDGQSVRDLLPHSEKAVFTHGDLHPGNILVKEKEEDDGSSGQLQIVGLIDFEFAGFLPDYWEFAQVMRFAPWRDDYGAEEEHKSKWWAVMERTAPEKWDIRAVNKARRVLF